MSDANWRPSNCSDTARLEMQGQDGSGGGDGTNDDEQCFGEWFKPKWLKRVPNNLADVSDDHRNLHLNWLWQHGWFIGGYNDCKTHQDNRRSLGWDGEAQTIGLWSGGKAWFPADKWPDFRRYYAHDLKVNFNLCDEDDDGDNGRSTATSKKYDDDDDDCSHIEAEEGAATPTPVVVAEHKKAPAKKPLKPLYETRSRYPVFVNEVYKGPQFKVALDLDFKGPKPESDKFLLGVSRCIHTVVVRYYPKRKRAPRCTVLRTKSCRDDTWGRLVRCAKSRKKISLDCMLMRTDGVLPTNENEAFGRFVDENESKGQSVKEVHKVGLHPVWDVLIKVEDVLQLVESIIFALEDKFGPRWEGYNSWREVVDAEPIMKGMLRMVGSIKQTACVICQRWSDLSMTCPGCYGMGKFVDDRPYMPWTVLAGAKGRQSPADVKRMYEDIEYMVYRCSVHAPIGKVVDEFCIPPNEPLAPPPTALQFTRTVRFTDGSVGGDITTSEFAADCHNFDRKSPDVRTSDMRFKVLSRLVRTTMPSFYEKLKVRRIRMRIFRGSPEYTIDIAGVGQHWCQNVNRNHKSNRIFMVCARDPIDKKQFYMWQRCWDQQCRKDKFRSKAHVIQQPFHNLLFYAPLQEIKAAVARQAAIAAGGGTAAATTALASSSSSLPPQQQQAAEVRPSAAAGTASSSQAAAAAGGGCSGSFSSNDAAAGEAAAAAASPLAPDYQMTAHERALTEMYDGLASGCGILSRLTS